MSALVIRAGEPAFGGHTHLAMFLEIDGYWIELVSGENVVPLHPGRYDIFVYCSYWGIRVGKARMTVDVVNGPTIVYYEPPRTLYTRGALSYKPRGRPGIRVDFVLNLLGLAFLLLCVIIGITMGD